MVRTSGAGSARLTSRSPCPGEGSVAVTWDDADESLAVFPGDASTIENRGCAAAGETWDGTMVLDIASLQGDPAPGSRRSFSAHFAFRGISITDAGGTAHLDGDLTVTATLEGTRFQGSLSGTRLAAALGGAQEEPRDAPITVEDDESTGEPAAGTA